MHQSSLSQPMNSGNKYGILSRAAASCKTHKAITLQRPRESFVATDSGEIPCDKSTRVTGLVLGSAKNLKRKEKYNSE